MRTISLREVQYFVKNTLKDKLQKTSETGEYAGKRRLRTVPTTTYASFSTQTVNGVYSHAGIRRGRVSIQTC